MLLLKLSKSLSQQITYLNLATKLRHILEQWIFPGFSFAILIPPCRYLLPSLLEIWTGHFPFFWNKCIKSCAAKLVIWVYQSFSSLQGLQVIMKKTALNFIFFFYWKAKTFHILLSIKIISENFTIQNVFLTSWSLVYDVFSKSMKGCTLWFNFRAPMHTKWRNESH